MDKLKGNQAKAYKSIELLPAQIEQAWELMQEVELPQNYAKFKNVVVCGMGGSNIGFGLVKYAIQDRLDTPVFINAEYNLPKFVNKETLVILSSYSGNTEEVLSCVQETIKNNLPGFIIAGGGVLGSLVNKKLPGIVFSDDFNPSDQPRWGLGYSIGSFLNLLTQVKALDLTEKKFLQHNKTVVVNDLLKDIANKLIDKAILVVGAEHLVGNAHILANQFNETADNLAFWLALPELNHHFLESLSFPKGLAKGKLVVLFLLSKNYSSNNKKRLKITQKVLDKQGVTSEILEINTSDTLEDSLSTLQLGSYVCYYIGVKNNIDPLAIPWVDFFKKEMKK